MQPKEVKLKIVGKVVMTTIEKQSYKVSLEKEGKDELKELVEKYNKKASTTILNKIIKIFTPKVVKPKEITKKKVDKKVAKKVQKEVKIITKKATIEQKVKEKVGEIVQSLPANTSTKVETVSEEIKKVNTVQVTPIHGERKRGEW